MHPPSTPDERSMYFSYVNPRSPGNAGTPRTGPAGILAHGDGHQRQAARVPARYEQMSARCLSGRWPSRSGYSVRPAPRLGAR